MVNNFAHLKASSPFYPIFPKGQVPIRNIIVPSVGVMEGDNQNQPQEFYDVDLAKLSPDQVKRIAQMVAIQCRGRAVVVEADMRARGFSPLRAIHVSGVSSDARAFL